MRIALSPWEGLVRQYSKIRGVFVQSMGFCAGDVMKLTIQSDDGILLDLDSTSLNVVSPLEQEERAAATRLLVSALALLCGVSTQPHSSVATEVEKDAPSSGNRQYPADRKSGVVVHLSKRPGASIGETTSE
jgi:hypothetical protein